MTDVTGKISLERGLLQLIGLVIAGLPVLFICLPVSLQSQVFYAFPEGNKISCICIVRGTEKMALKS